jgi:hypothetical protein
VDFLDKEIMVVLLPLLPLVLVEVVQEPQVVLEQVRLAVQEVLDSQLLSMVLPHFMAVVVVDVDLLLLVLEVMVVEELEQ